MNDDTPYDELDPNIVNLVRALNTFDGIRTVGSCGGHPKPNPDQWPEGTWYVKFRVTQDDDGWFALEFLAWVINHDARRAGHEVTLYPTSAPPYLNSPGRMLHFALEGYGEDPEWLAGWIDELRESRYIPPQAAYPFGEEENTETV